MFESEISLNRQTIWPAEPTSQAGVAYARSVTATDWSHRTFWSNLVGLMEFHIDDIRLVLYFYVIRMSYEAY